MTSILGTAAQMARELLSEASYSDPSVGIFAVLDPIAGAYNNAVAEHDDALFAEDRAYWREVMVHLESERADYESTAMAYMLGRRRR